MLLMAPHLSRTCANLSLFLQAILPAHPGVSDLPRAAGNGHRGHPAPARGAERGTGSWLHHSEDGKTSELRGGENLKIEEQNLKTKTKNLI